MTDRPTPGLLLVWTDMARELQAGFAEWYNRSHMPERILGVPGFRVGRRFEAYAGGPQFMALYQAESAAVMHSAPYLALKSNPDDTSRRYIPAFRNVLKGVFDVTAEAGVAEGACVAMLPLTAHPGREAAARAWMRADLVPALVARPGIMAARYAERNAAALESATRGHIRTTDRFLAGLLMIEAVSDADLDAALDLVAPDRLAAQGLAPEAPGARLRVIFAIRPRALDDAVAS